MQRDAIVVKDLTKTEGKKVILSHINLTVHAGEIAILLGPLNGGKEVLINTMLKLTKFDEGKISYFDHDITKERDYIMNFLGYAPKNGFYINSMKVKDFFNYSEKFYQGGYLDNALSLCEYFKLDETKKIKDLDKAELKKLSIISAIFFKPEVVILALPADCLDLDSKALLFSLLRDLKKEGNAILITSDNLDDYSEIADQEFLIVDGEIKDQAILKKMKKDYKKVTVELPLDPSPDMFKSSHYKMLNITKNNVSFIYEGDVNHLIAELKALNLLNVSIKSPSIEELMEGLK